MAFMVVRRTWSPDSVPGGRGSGTLRIDVVGYGNTRQEAEKLAKQRASEFPANGYNRKSDYWWARDSDFRYTFTAEERQDAVG